MRQLDIRLSQLELARLPGPNTTTKLHAAASTDPRFQAMLAEAARIGWPQGFENDLYQHDLAILEACPEQKMVWVLRDSGTNLFPIQADSPGAAHYSRCVLRYWSGDDKLNFIPEPAERPRFYFVGPAGIEETTAIAAAAAIESPARVRGSVDG